MAPTPQRQLSSCARCSREARSPRSSALRSACLLLCQRFLTLCTHHTRSRTRSVATNFLGPDVGAALAEGLKGNSTLQSLEYAANDSNRFPRVRLSVETYRGSPPSHMAALPVCNQPPPQVIACVSAPIDTLLLPCGSLGNNTLCGINESGEGTYTTEGIAMLCEGLKGSAVTSLK